MRVGVVVSQMNTMAKRQAEGRPPALLWALLLMAAVLVVIPARAQQIALSTSADSVAVGERISLTITAEHDGTSTPVFPDPARGDSTLGDLLLLKRLSTGSAIAPSGSRRDSAVYEVTTFALDTAQVAPFPIQFTMDGGTTLTASTPPLVIPVRSIVPADAQDIKDLAPLVEFSRPWWFWALVVLAVLALALLAWYLWRRWRDRRTAPAPSAPTHHLSPYEQAIERLRRLEETGALHPDQVKPYYVELSDVVRTYLARQFDVPAHEQTSRELLLEISHMAREDRFPSAAVSHVAHVLDIADLVKFADMHPGADTTRAVLDETRTTIEEIEAALRPAPSPAEPTEQPA